MLPRLMSVLAVGSVSSVDVIRISGIALGSMVMFGVVAVIPTIGFCAQCQMRCTPIIVLVVLALIRKSRDRGVVMSIGRWILRVGVRRIISGHCWVVVGSFCIRGMVPIANDRVVDTGGTCALL